MRLILKIFALANALALLLFFVRYRSEEVHPHKSAATPHQPLTPKRNTLHATLNEVLPDKPGLAAPDDQALLGADGVIETSLGEQLLQLEPDFGPNRDLLMSSSKADAHMFRPSEFSEEEKPSGDGTLSDDAIGTQGLGARIDVIIPHKQRNIPSNEESESESFGTPTNHRKAAVKNK